MRITTREYSSGFVKETIDSSVHIFSITISTFVREVTNLRVRNNFVDPVLLGLEVDFVNGRFALLPSSFKATSYPPLRVDDVIVPW